MTAKNMDGTSIDTHVAFSMHQVLAETLDLNRPVKPVQIISQTDTFDIRMKCWPVKQED